MLFPQNLVLAEAATADVIPQGLGDVLHTLLANIVSNPLSADYERQLHWHPDVGLPVWLGHEEHRHVTRTKKFYGQILRTPFHNIVRWVINLAPFGIMGLVFTNVARQRPVHLYAVWPPIAVAGGYHAADGSGHQPADHFHLSALQPVSTGVSAACASPA